MFHLIGCATHEMIPEILWLMHVCVPMGDWTFVGLDFLSSERLSEYGFWKTNVNWCLIFQIKMDFWVPMTLGFLFVEHCWVMGYGWTQVFENDANMDWILVSGNGNRYWTFGTLSSCQYWLDFWYFIWLPIHTGLLVGGKGFTSRLCELWQCCD